MHAVLRSISLHVCFMERNGHSCLTDSLKAKLNICVLILSPFSFFVNMPSVLDVYFIDLLCTQVIYVDTFFSGKYTLTDFRLKSPIRGHLVLASPVSELATILLKCVS